MCEHPSLHQESFKGTFGAKINESQLSGSSTTQTLPLRHWLRLWGGADLAWGRMYDSGGVMKDKSWSAELQGRDGIATDFSLTLPNPVQRPVGVQEAG